MDLLKQGTILGHYRIESAFKQGGMSVVYRATDLQRQSEVAIKQCITDNEKFKEDFAKEAVILSTLHHRAIPEVLSPPPNGEDLVVMRYIKGQNLAEYIATNSIDLETKIYWADTLLDALEYLHINKVIHRDIKPENVIVTEQNEIYLVDFGLANIGVAIANAHTPNYASPEQIRYQATDELSDIYSMGATLYFLFTGDIPHPANKREILSKEGDAKYKNKDLKHINETITKQGDISKHLREALLKALILEPTKRYTSAAEMRREVCLELGHYRIISNSMRWSRDGGILEAEDLSLGRKPVFIRYWKRDKHIDTAKAEETIGILRETEQGDPQLPFIHRSYQRGPFFCVLFDRTPGATLEQHLAGLTAPLPGLTVRNWTEQLLGLLKRVENLPNPPLRWTITPSNLIVTTEEGQEKIGLWRYDLAERAEYNDDYAAPEEGGIRGQRTIQSDIYRFGAILYQLLTGDKPPSALDRRAAIDYDGTDLLQLDAIDHRIRPLLEQSLAMNQENRFKKVEELQEKFERVGPRFWNTNPLPQPPPDENRTLPSFSNEVELRHSAALVYSFLASRPLHFFERIVEESPILTISLPPLTEQNPQVPPFLDDILHRILSPKHDDPPVNFENVIQQLKYLLLLQERQVQLANVQTLVVYLQKLSPAQEQRLKTFQSLAEISAAGMLPYKADRAIQAIKDIALALDSLHDITQNPHGDICLATIRVNPAGNARLMLDVNRDDTTQDKTLMAPEQRLNELQPTLESERFAIAAASYYLLIKQPPPQNIPANHQEFRTQISQELNKVLNNIVARRSIHRAASNSTANVLAKGMALIPERRFINARGFADTLERALKEDRLL